MGFSDIVYDLDGNTLKDFYGWKESDIICCFKQSSIVRFYEPVIVIANKIFASSKLRTIRCIWS